MSGSGAAYDYAEFTDRETAALPRQGGAGYALHVGRDEVVIAGRLLRAPAQQSSNTLTFVESRSFDLREELERLLLEVPIYTAVQLEAATAAAERSQSVLTHSDLVSIARLLADDFVDHED